MDACATSLRNALLSAHAYRKDPSANANEFRASLNALKMAFRAIAVQERQTFLNSREHKQDVFLIYSICMGPKSLSLNVPEAVKGPIVSLFQSFFSLFGYALGPSLFFDGIATDIFQNFIEGITYFNREFTTQRPVYHRPSVCGSGAQQWSVKMTFDPNDSQFIRQYKEWMVRRCYIERSILNRIYEHVFQHPQDSRHLRELRTMENMYLHLWNHESLSIDVRFHPYSRFDIFPSVLVLCYQEGDKYIQEEYTKSHNMVYARKSVKHSRTQTQTLYYEKTQSFAQEMPWKKVPIRGGNMSLIPKRAWKNPRPSMPKNARSF